MSSLTYYLIHSLTHVILTLFLPEALSLAEFVEPISSNDSSSTSERFLFF